MPKKKKKSEMTGDEIELAFQKWCALENRRFNPIDTLPARSNGYVPTGVVLRYPLYDIPGMSNVYMPVVADDALTPDNCRKQGFNGWVLMWKLFSQRG